MKFIKGPYNLSPILIDGVFSPQHNIGALVEENGKYYMITKNGLNEVYYNGNNQGS